MLKRIFVIIVLVAFAFTVKAQQNHFIYLQTEGEQPFYVKFDNKLISSSPAGYLIIPEVSEGTYDLVVGFPKNEFPEEGFDIAIDQSNKGFLLKNFGEKGWGLFNMQSLALVTSKETNSKDINKEEAVAEVKPEIKNDAFSNMLANVVKDSSILSTAQPVIQAKEIKKPEISAGAPDAAAIKKVLSKKDNEGLQLVYLDNTSSITDTVRIFIPEGNNLQPKSQEKAPEKAPEVLTENSTPKSGGDTVRFTITPTVITRDSDIITQEKDTIKIYKERPSSNAETTKLKKVENQEPNSLITIIEPKAEKPAEKTPEKNDGQMIVLPKVVTSSAVNSDCKDFATDSDFLKLRKKMASESDNDDMIRIAKKVFHTKCFSTEQIKNLSFLFLTDEGKYMFLDAAYPFASDSDQYFSLVSQLTDQYYISRFNAMIHK